MSHPGTSEIVEIFREFARQMSIAHRAHENARHTSASMERTEYALSKMQSLEAEFEDCFRLMRKPDWARVEARAKGEIK